MIAVDLDAVAANAAALVEVAGGAALCAVVKADGYGHGSVGVARAALAGGATWLAVALVEEGRVLRDAGHRRADPRAVRAAAGRDGRGARGPADAHALHAGGRRIRRERGR